ncbi:PREDICTED: syntaxin-81-like isoform X3 [Nelumbo nucifera]|uniref:Syntaxin-81-like isoform X3 n=1 Tax=Nelumbo nucifera TaxID=4432 RepID=A0A1U7Z4X3_NELNU|nr:PREDICTED: syntaxin-81-like isoform X3 [Nelumbo nucifera]
MVQMTAAGNMNQMVTPATIRSSPCKLCMARSRDRTEDFKDTVRSIALSLGYNESKTAATLASFIMHKPRQRSTFTKAALRTLESIKTLEQFIMKHWKDYVDPHRATEQERDSIEHEVLILSEKLHSVTSQFDQLRAIRFQDAVNKAIPRRKMHQVTNSNSPIISKSNHSEVKEPDELPSEHLRVQQQFLDDETRALQVELTNLLDTVQETETKMVEMSALNHLMATHVLQQAQQIELLYEQAVEATNNVEMGNKELSQAMQRNSSSRTFLLLFLFVLTFSILFLDWYN